MMFSVKMHGWMTWAIVRDGQPYSALTPSEIMAVLGYEPPVVVLNANGLNGTIAFPDNARWLKWAFMLRDQLNGIAAQRNGES